MGLCQKTRYELGSEAREFPMTDDQSSKPNTAAGNGEKVATADRRLVISPATAALIVVGLACVAAIIWRVPLRSLYWASRVIAAKSNDDFAAHVTLLCQAGDAGRWGTARLLRHHDAAIRQAGVVVLQHCRGEWSKKQLVSCLSDADETTADLAAIGIALRRGEFEQSELRRLCESADPSIATAAVYALGRAAQPDDDEILSAVLTNSGEAAIQAETIEALQAFHTESAATALLSALERPDAFTGVTRAERVAQRAFAGAARTGGPTINGSASDISDSQTIAARAAVALGRVTGLKAADDAAPTNDEILAWKNWRPH